jgi:tetratricopeptide (TPR) repeat protein
MVATDEMVEESRMHRATIFALVMFLSTIVSRPARSAEAETEADIPIDVSSFQCELGHDPGKLELVDAVTRAEKAETAAKRHLGDKYKPGPKALEAASAMQKLAAIYEQRQGCGFWAAGALYRRSLFLTAKVDGKSSPALLTSTDGLARICLQQFDFAQAKTLAQRSLKIREHTYGKQDQGLVEPLRVIANACRYLQQDVHDCAPEARVSILKRALAIRERNLAPMDPELIDELEELADAHLAADQRETGYAIYERVISIRERSLGPNDPKVARDLNHVAQIYESDNRFGPAENLLKRSLDIDEVWRVRHPTYARVDLQVAEDLRDLAHVYWSQGRAAKADELEERARSIQGIKR